MKNKLKGSQVVAYGFFGMFLNTFYLMFLAYFRLIYLTDVLKLSTTVSAIVNSLATWGNVVTMLLAGVLIDKVNFKTGKYRTWTLVGGIIMGISFPLLFSNLGLSQGAAGAMFIVMFIVQSIGYNCLWVAERSLVGPMSSCSQDATNLAMAAQQASTIGSLAFGVLNTPLMSALGGSYTLSALIYGLFITGGTVGMFFLAKNYDTGAAPAPVAPKQEKAKGGTLAALTGPVIPFVIAMILTNAHLGFFMTLLAYFTQYVLNDPAILSISVAAGALAGLLGAWVSTIVCRKMGKKMAFVIFTLLTGLLYMMIAWFGSSSIPFLIIRIAIGAFSVVGGMLIPVFANDISDYNLMKYGKDNRAVIQSISGTTIRMGTALATTIASFGLAAVGYSATAEITPTIISAITALMAYGPAAVCVLSALTFIFYKVDEKELDAWRAEQFSNK